MNKIKSGISLIVLVITILVLSILAATVIISVSNTNVISQANGAVEKHSAQAEKEAVVYAATTSIGQNKGEVKLEDIQDALTDASVKAEGDKIAVQFNNSNRKYVIDKKGAVTVKAASGAWKVNEDGNFTLTKDGKTIELAVGDKVTYNPASGVGKDLSYTSNANKNGYKDQTFTASKYTGSWYVFGEEEGNLVLISDVITPDGLESYGLRGAKGYINSEEEFQNIADVYGQGDNAIYARCINLEDINSITKYPIEKQNEGSVHAYGNTVTYERQGSSVTYTAVKPNGENAGSGNADKVTEEKSFKYIKDGEFKILKDGETVSFTSNYCSYKITDYTNDNNKKYIDMLLGKGDYWLDYRFERPIGINVIWGHLMIKDGEAPEVDKKYSLLSSDLNESEGSSGIRILVYVDYATLAQAD